MFIINSRVQTMANDTQQSFIATLQVPNHNLHLLGTLHGRPAIVADLLGSAGFYSGRPQTRDDSGALGIEPHAKGGVKAPLKLYFRHTTMGYEIHIKHTGRYDRHRLAKNHANTLYARSPTLKDPLNFTLLDPNNTVITGSTLSTAHTLIALKTHNNRYIGVKRDKGSPYVYLGETTENHKMIFLLSVIERNVPY